MSTSPTPKQDTKTCDSETCNSETCNSETTLPLYEQKPYHTMWVLHLNSRRNILKCVFPPPPRYKGRYWIEDGVVTRIALASTLTFSKDEFTQFEKYDYHDMDMECMIYRIRDQDITHMFVMFMSIDEEGKPTLPDHDYFLGFQTPMHFAYQLYD